MKIGIVGSGPAGFYTAQRILQKCPSARIDMFDKLPVPYGLIRYGVAPDHPEVKNVIHKFEQLASDARLRWFGKIDVGKDVSFSDMHLMYESVILATGAYEERKLNIPGENLGNVISSKAFVDWYNGAFDVGSVPNLETDTAVIVGHGNVSLDIARILLSPIQRLETTDIPQSALEILRKNRINRVFIVGRRGPLNISFTPKELRELVHLENLVVDQSLLEIALRENIEQRSTKRMLELLLKPKTDGSKSWHLQFFSSPFQVIGKDSCQKVLFEETRLEQNGKFVKTGKVREIDCGLLIHSLGFDKKAEIVPGVYRSGWCRTGAVGDIASTRIDAISTADLLIENFKATKGALYDVKDFLNERKIPFVTFDQWKVIDSIEVKRGEVMAKPREKITDKKELLQLIKQ